MQFAVTKGEQTLAELAERVYEFEGTPSATALREAQRALVAANPFLRKPAEVAEGTVLAVPALGRAAPSAETQPLAAVAGRATAGALQAALAGAVESVGRVLTEGRVAVDDSLAMLRSREVKQLARDDPAATEGLRRTTEAAKSRAAELDELERYQGEAFAQLDEDMKALVEALGRART
jgi:hypothetical protein